jgi:hypothetical protein
MCALLYLVHLGVQVRVVGSSNKQPAHHQTHMGSVVSVH